MNLKNVRNIQRVCLALLAFLIVAFCIWGFLYPSFASRSHVTTERGSVEQGYLDLLMEDWRVVQPCAPVRYATGDAPESSCPNGEDHVVVESTCWFGVPGPRFQLCYADTESAELGTTQPSLFP